VMYLRVGGFSGNLRCFSVLNAHINYTAVFPMRVKLRLCSIFLFSDGSKVIVYVVSCPL
jgi:hypothetical protein